MCSGPLEPQCARDVDVRRVILVRLQCWGNGAVESFVGASAGRTASALGLTELGSKLTRLTLAITPSSTHDSMQLRELD